MVNTPDNFFFFFFAQFILQDCVLVPKSLLTNYRLLPLNEKDLLLLLRVSGPLFRNGHLTLKEASAELGVSPEEAAVLLQPLLAGGILGMDKAGRSYHANGLFRFLHECWLNEQRYAAPGEQVGEQRTTPNREVAKDYVLTMSRLYRRFEAEFGRSLKYSENEQIRQWLEDDGLPADLVEEALRRAVLRNKGTLAYINSILRDWEKKGYKTLDQVLELDVKPEKQRKTAKRSSQDEDPEFLKQLAQIEADAFRM